MIQKVLAFDRYAQELFREKRVFLERYCYQQIDKQTRLLGIAGLRGVGKTQYLLHRRSLEPKSIYISCDLDFIDPEKFLDTLLEFHKEYDIQYFFLDEIHFLPNRAALLKNFYDFSNAFIIYSGSSMIDILHNTHDLSRRAIQYTIPIFTYREYLSFDDINIPKNPLTLDELKNKSASFSHELIQFHSKQKFQHYLSYGQFGYARESSSPLSYRLQLNNSLRKSLYEDISQFYTLKTSSLLLLEKVVQFLANTSTSEVNYKKIADAIGVDNKTITNYIDYLVQLGWLYCIDKSGDLSDQLRKQQKIYFSNTNIIDYLIKENNSMKLGIMRESFAIDMFHIRKLYETMDIQHLSTTDVCITKDTVVSNREIGGKNKKRASHTFVIADDIDYAQANTIPLWLLGFLG